MEPGRLRQELKGSGVTVSVRGNRILVENADQALFHLSVEVNRIREEIVELLGGGNIPACNIVEIRRNGREARGPGLPARAPRPR
jgi:hypothetical protein